MANSASWAEGLRGRAPAPTRTRGDCWPLPFSCVQIPRKRLGKARESPGQPQPWSRGWAPGKIHTCELSPNEKHGGFSILTQWFTREQHKTKCPVPSWDHLHSEGHSTGYQYTSEPRSEPQVLPASRRELSSPEETKSTFLRGQMKILKLSRKFKCRLMKQGQSRSTHFGQRLWAICSV